ncbi:hypothetical protein ACFWP3_19025 [Streptomyces sp. NPDC058525]|uniref:hypothetical protein n=1 Tax=Streptomyces sp. NPDC058525 TaxID=3346538 RepID=UPI0036587999
MTTEMLPQLIPYTPPLARDSEHCPCGDSGPTCEESMCRPCRELAVATHGQRLTRLLSTICYDHRGVRLTWTEASGYASAFTPRVDFLMPDVHNPEGPLHLFRGFAYWEDDQLIAACAKGARDEEILALALAMAHYALATLAIHEVDEWYSYRSAQVYPLTDLTRTCHRTRTGDPTATAPLSSGSPTAARPMRRPVSRWETRPDGHVTSPLRGMTWRTCLARPCTLTSKAYA